MEKLTEDLIIDILSRLPTLSLLQSTCVRKSWYHIITTDPIFTTLRNNRSSISTDALIFRSPNKLYLTQINDAPFIQKIDLSSVLHEISIQRFYLKVVGVCNGLICLATFPKVMIVSGTTHMINSFYIINPISKENLQVPKFNGRLNIGSTSKIKRMLYGFGFDQRNQVFKLVVFVFGLGDDNVNKLIFTLGGEASASGWRRVLGSIPCMMRYARGSISNIYVDGCLHWIAGTTIPNSTDRTMMIMSYNLSDEAFGVIRTPELLVVSQDIYCMQIYYSLAVLDNCLCWVDSKSKKHINIWIKKGGESWVKSFCLKKSVIPPRIYGRVTPIKFEPNGQLFLRYPYGVVCYNVQDNTTRSFDLNEAHEIFQTEVFPFVGSFISINSH